MVQENKISNWNGLEYKPLYRLTTINGVLKIIPYIIYGWCFEYKMEFSFMLPISKRWSQLWLCNYMLWSVNKWTNKINRKKKRELLFCTEKPGQLWHYILYYICIMYITSVSRWLICLSTLFVHIFPMGIFAQYFEENKEPTKDYFKTFIRSNN